jgi:hypothetical protein
MIADGSGKTKGRLRKGLLKMVSEFGEFGGFEGFLGERVQEAFCPALLY